MAAARLIAVLCAALTLAACEDSTPAPTGSYEYDAETGTISASAPGEAGDTVMLSGPEIAAPLPVDIPILADAEITKATHVIAPGGLRIALVEMLSEQSPAEIAEFYRGAARAAGLSSALDLAGPGGITFIAIGEDRRRMTLHAAPIRIAPGGTHAPERSEDADADTLSAEEGLQPAYRDMTAAQLYIIGRAPPAPDETPQAS